MSALAVSDGDGFGRHIETVSRALLGEPNAAMSKATELRFRTRGSMAVDLEKGAWHDHESGQGGGVLDLIVYQGEAKTKSQAVKWLDAQGIRPANLNTPAVRSVLAEDVQLHRCRRRFAVPGVSLRAENVQAASSRR